MNTFVVLNGFQKSLCPCASDESSLSMGRVNRAAGGQIYYVLHHLLNL